MLFEQLFQSGLLGAREVCVQSKNHASHTCRFLGSLNHKSLTYVVNDTRCVTLHAENGINE